MGNTSSDAEFTDCFTKAGSDVTCFLGATFGSVTDIFKKYVKRIR